MYEPDEDDIVEHSGGPARVPGWARHPRWLPARDWRPSRGAAILGIAGLIVGLVAGYAAGYRGLAQAVRSSRATATGAAHPAASGRGLEASAPGPTPAWYSLGQTTGACSVQHGRDLQVGVEVVNLSPSTVIAGQVKPVLPLGGLHAVSQQWAPCGAISGPASVQTGAANIVPPGNTAWFSVTFQVLVACPGPLPVGFNVSYQENGRRYTVSLVGFPDLGQVPYTGCAGS